MQIVGGFLLIIGLMKNKDPIKFNKGIFGDAEGADAGPAASMRMLIGGAFAGIGAMNLYLSMNVDDAAAKAVLMGNAIAFALILATCRGQTQRLPRRDTYAPNGDFSGTNCNLPLLCNGINWLE